ncbi:Beta-barrel assembly-enhancing protease [Emticicia aquatica]|uniref:Beta-barrel assembly-enhancing protease n=1 Tax=Emticicia aquatica TaxID=1681835 RepID=A0ABM9AMW9_9BACT|nr:tetratricopeptide repeat protein [Emticicia aquatica]CAH0994953.1 Beta-barrel assembly-enhancing protease [Emticicia aquatica]
MKKTFNTFNIISAYICLIVIIGGCGRAKKDTELFFIQGNVAYKKGNFEEAIKFYSEAIDKTPKFADAYNNRGSVKLAMDNIDGAILDFEKAVSIDNKFYLAKYNLAEAYSNTDKLDESLSLLKQISQQYKDSSFYFVTLSNVFINKNNFAEASANLATALRLNDKNDKALTNLGYIQYSEKNFEASKNNFEKAIAINPRQDFALNNLSLIYSLNEDYNKALEIIEKALLINNNEIYQNNKSYYLINLNKLEDGRKIIQSVLEKNDKNAWAYRNMGVFYLKSKNYSLALENFMKADKLDPSVELLNYYLGITQQNLGNESKACEYWKIGQKINEVKSIEMLAKVCK